MKKKLTIIVCLALVIAATCGCTTFNNFRNAFFSPEATETQPDQNTIKIGVYEPLSGQYREQGNLERIGIELAHELYPQVAGKEVELIYADNQSDMYAAETAIQELVAQKPSVILGSYGETVTLVAGDPVKANNIPAISITSTNPLITVNNSYYFCATFADNKQGDAMADFIFTAQGKTTVATVKMAGDDTATATMQRFNARFKNVSANNDSVVGSFELDANSNDYSAALDGILESGAQAVFLDVSPAVAMEFLEQAREANMTSLLYAGTSRWNTEEFIAYAEDSEDMTIAYASDYSSSIHTSTIQELFINAYEEKYGEGAEPAEATALAFDAYMMAISAIQEAYNETMATDSEAIAEQYTTDAAIRSETEALMEAKQTGIPMGQTIRDCLANLSYDGVSGSISYNGTNEADKNVIVNCIIDGEAQEAYII